jgi:hypothetical protein
MCVTNLRGVPYLVSKQGADPNIKGHRMIHHADYMQFALGTNPESESNAILLNPNGGNVNAWQLMVDAALASSAYPVGLAPRNLVRSSIKEYEQRWKVKTPLSKEKSSPDRSITTDISLVGTGPYEFVVVDGGTVNNEPIELVRGFLRDGEQHNQRKPQQANRATVLIDPFPNDVAVENPKYDLLNIVMRLFYSLMANARFKPEELILAQDEDIYSRFLISPVRDGDHLSPLACGSVRAFGGFLHQIFRHHDYILGRRNCQKFLKDYFVLSLSNQLYTVDCR